MEKRAILAIGLSILVFIAFQYIQQQRQGQRIQPQQITPMQNPAQEPPVSGSAPAVPAEDITPPVTTSADAIAASAEDTHATAQEVVIESDLYRAVIDNRGGVIVSWQLKEYTSARDEIFEMIGGKQNGDERLYPASLLFEDPAMSDLANNEFYQVSVEGGSGGPYSLAPPVTVVLSLKRGDFSVEKRYSFKKDNYIVDLALASRRGGKQLEGQFFLGDDLGPEYEHLLSSSRLEAVYYSEGKVRRESPPKDPSEVVKIDGDTRWVGLDMHYFALIAIPERSLRSFNIQKNPISGVGIDGEEISRDLLKVTTPIDGALQYQLYLGPKKQSNLKAVTKADIRGVINFGMFSILVHPLLSSLRWVQQYVHNYGFSIVILTLILSILLFPFRLKSMISMKKMQSVQPQVKAIQEKYRRYKKTDPKRAEMNQEIMALYKKHGANPLGGCLPMILQMPLLFAFYSLLMNAIELRQAPFMGWIQDLSVKDPYYVLPIVMGLTMFISQKMTPMTPGADPTQAKMMMFMPILFTLLFFNVSSGLNLYFLCSNIFQVGFQKIFERWIGDGKSKRPAKSPAK